MMKKISISLIVLVLGIFACVKENSVSDNQTPTAIKQKKVNEGASFIVSDDKANTTKSPFTTQSQSDQRIRHYWAGAAPDLVVGDNVFAIADVLRYFDQSDKMVIAVEGIATKQVSYVLYAYNDIKAQLQTAEAGATYYYIVDKVTLTREAPSATEPAGLIHALDAQGFPVKYIHFNMGSQVKNGEVWYSLSLRPATINNNLNDNGTLTPRFMPDGGGSGVDIP